jgi:non-ribosomal peptide synthetase component E (peptide arylation enzyme)
MTAMNLPDENAGAGARFPNLTIHGLLKEAVSKFASSPSAAALVFGERRLTFREIEKRVEQLAASLSGMGVDRRKPPRAEVFIGRGFYQGGMR